MKQQSLTAVIFLATAQACELKPEILAETNYWTMEDAEDYTFVEGLFDSFEDIIEDFSGHFWFNEPNENLTI